MASILFSNNASGALASSITSTATTITLTTGAGAQFPAISGSNYFYATLTDSSNNLEIVKVTARATDVLTVVRAQEGTTGRAYAAADKLELRVTAAVMTNLPQLAADQTFSGANTFSGTNTFSGATSLASPTMTGTPVAPTASPGTNTTQVATTAFVQAAALTLATIYPVGSIYTSTVSTSPATLFGFGTWVAFGAGRVLMGTDGSTYTAGSTGGSADAVVPAHTHTATTAITDPGHYHTINGYGGGYDHVTSTPSGDSFNNPVTMSTNNATTGITAATTVTSTGVSATGANLQPYVVVYMWNRTA